MLNKISGGLFFVGFLPYIWAILNGETHPSPVSWVIWAGVDTLALLAMSKKDASRGQLTGAVIGGWVIATLALFFGKPTMGPVEWFSIAGAVTGIVLWKKTGNPILAIISSQVTVFIASIPTFVNAYHNPVQEDPIAWSIWTLSCVFALFAIRKWDLANALQPLTFTVVEVTMIYLVILRPLWM